METAVLILGSNLGDRKTFLDRAIIAIGKEVGRILVKSSVYTSSAWGFEGKEFYNQVLVLETSWEAMEILKWIKDFERDSGREVRKGGYKDRTIDVDICYYGDQIIEAAGLTIPHPALHARNFVLKPLVEILPDFNHPVLNKNHQELLEICVDNGICEVLKDV